MFSLWNLVNIVLVILLCLLPGVGIVVTAMGRRTHGRAALMGMIGCVALLLEGLLRVVQVLFLPSLVGEMGLGVTGIIAALSLVSFVLTVVGISMLIWAVVMRRPAQAAAPGRPGPQAGPQQGWQQPGWPQQNPQQFQAGPYQNPQQGPPSGPQQGW